MKIIFLDIDGVLNSDQFDIMRDRNSHIPDKEMFCPISCSNLIWLLERDPSIKIVVSSAWRKNRSLDDLKRILAKNRIPADRVIGKTIELCPTDELDRGKEIDAFLRDNKAEEFVIIDDNPTDEHQRHRLVLVNGTHGFMFMDAQKACTILKVGFTLWRFE